MKPFIAFIFFLVITTSLHAQTARIAHRSHSGKSFIPGVTGSDNFGLPDHMEEIMIKEQQKQKAKEDSADNIKPEPVEVPESENQEIELIEDTSSFNAPIRENFKEGSVKAAKPLKVFKKPAPSNPEPEVDKTPEDKVVVKTAGSASPEPGKSLWYLGLTILAIAPVVITLIRKDRKVE